MSMGYRVARRERKVDADRAAAFIGLPVANVSDVMGRMFAGGSAIRPIHLEPFQVAGPALTVRSRPGDNLMFHHALDIAEPGDVIVVDAGGDTTNALMGEIMVGIAIRNQVAAIVVDGAIRDRDEIRSMGFPLYARGITHRGPYKDGPGEVNVPITIDGMVVNPGDLVLGDGDGVLAVPYDHVDEVLAAAQDKSALEERQIASIEDGTLDRSWVMEKLVAGGCTFE
ncbi:MAG TPA: RraA family protein [Nitriliruptoraceae bacterium]|nr:RraA family protein [Nitriliruptoraceae bacterium]